jgi:hypothetical protein
MEVLLCLAVTHLLATLRAAASLQTTVSQATLNSTSPEPFWRLKAHTMAGKQHNMVTAEKYQLIHTMAGTQHSMVTAERNQPIHISIRNHIDRSTQNHVPKLGTKLRKDKIIL